jgi:uncharacterized metal-binding protein
MTSSNTARKPILFACAGCSFAGRLAYDLAQELDRRGVAEMSCLAGVAAEKRAFLSKLQGREVWIIDGCPIECSQGVFDRVGHRVHRHIRLHDLGFKKLAAPPEGIDMNALVARVLDLARA